MLWGACEDDVVNSVVYGNQCFQTSYSTVGHNRKRNQFHYLSLKTVETATAGRNTGVQKILFCRSTMPTYRYHLDGFY